MLADTLAIALFNLHVLGNDDFETPASEAAPGAMDLAPADSAVMYEPLGSMTPPERTQGEGVFTTVQTGEAATGDTTAKSPMCLSKEAFKRVLTLFSRKMETEFHHPMAKRQMSYNDALVFQARQYRRLVEGDADGYEPLMLR